MLSLNDAMHPVELSKIPKTDYVDEHRAAEIFQCTKEDLQDLYKAQILEDTVNYIIDEQEIKFVLIDNVIISDVKEFFKERNKRLSKDFSVIKNHTKIKKDSSIPEGFVTTKEAAKLLGHSRPTSINSLCRTGKLDYKKVDFRRGRAGYRYVVSVASIEAYKEALTEPPTPEGFVTTKEAARLLGYSCSASTNILCRTGKLDYKKVDFRRSNTGYKYVISVASIKEYKRANYKKIRAFDTSNSSNVKNKTTSIGKENKMTTKKINKVETNKNLKFKNVFDLKTLILVYPYFEELFHNIKDEELPDLIIGFIKYFEKEIPNYLKKGKTKGFFTDVLNILRRDESTLIKHALNKNNDLNG